MKTLIDLLSAASSRGYIGEPVSQLEHALQAAYFAKRAGATDELVVAALLHDVGHLIADESLATMDHWGVREHELVGAKFLRAQGAPERVCELVASHVQAKRYLVFKNPAYREKLSDASTQTLLYQGGPMSEDEAREFENDPLFREKIALRNFDERAKVANLEVPALPSYEPLLRAIFNCP